MIEGTCHCGNIRFELDWIDGMTEVVSRACGCSFCRKHNAAWTSSPGDKVRLFLRDSERVHRYRFGTRTADFLFCSDCAVVPLAMSEIDQQWYAVVNVHCFDCFESDRLVESATDFDGESVESRLARRQQNWSKVVRIEAGS